MLFTNLSDTDPIEVQVASFMGFPYGLNTNLEPSLLSTKELAEAVNVMFRPQGKLVNRPALVRVTDTAIGTPTDRKTANLLSGQYVFSADTSGKIYYDVGSTPTLIGTVSGEPFLLPYKGAVLIMDGSYLKYCTDTSEIKIAYDAGGSGWQYDVWDYETDGAVTGASIGVSFTSQSWDSGYTIPITKVEFKIIGTTASASVTVKLKKTDGTVIASKALEESISTTNVLEYFVTFTDDDITEEMDPGTQYYCVLEGTDFELQYHTVSADGRYYDGTSVDPTKDPLMRIYPGVPPKASFGVITGKDAAARLFILNPDEPGRVYFGNMSYLDWSTDNGGGWVGVIDDDKNSFKVGSLGMLFGVLYVYGDKSNPYLCALSGSEPNQFSITSVFQHASASTKTLINANNDLLNASELGMSKLKGVQESGDVRTYPITERIQDKIVEYWSDEAFLGFDPKYGHVLLQLPNYSRVLVANTKFPFTEPGQETRTSFPWSEFELPITPVYFSQSEQDFIIGADDGYFYQFSSETYKDPNSINIDITIKSAQVKIPGTDLDLNEYQIYIDSLLGSELDFTVFANGNAVDYAFKQTITIPMSDSVTVDDLTIEVDDWLSAINPSSTVLYHPLNINCFAFQWTVDQVKLVGSNFNFDGVQIFYEGLIP